MFWLLLSCNFWFLRLVNCDKKLIAAHLAYRHGNRTAESTFPTNPFKGWDDKIGLLTNEGKITEYQLGIAIKDRYVKKHKLVHNSYVSKDVTIRSSPSDRCLNSGQLQAAGMYPPFGDEIWSKSLLWNPIPIHTTKVNEDYLLQNFVVKCPTLSKSKERIMKTDEYVALRMSQKGFINDISMKAGTEYNLENLYMINDVLVTQSENNKSLPTWLNPMITKRLHDVSFAQNKLLFYNQDEELKKLNGGYLLFTMVNQLSRITKMNNETSLVYVGEELEVNKKLHLYSTHDIMVVSLMNTLDIPYDQFLPYGVAISIELYYDSQNGYTVEIYMRNSSEEFHLIELKRCPSPCTMDKFMKVYKDRFVQDLKDECFAKEEEIKYLPGFIFFVLLSAILIAVIVVLIKFLPKLKRTKSEHDVHV